MSVQKLTIRSMAASSVLIFVASTSFAKDLTHRLGIGYKNQFHTDLPGLAVQYWPSTDVGISGTFAIDTEKGNSRFGSMAKLYKVIFPEDNLNFYMGTGAGMVSVEKGGVSESGFELVGFLGCEFFLPGLENLGLNFETGFAVTSISSGVRFRTVADSPLRAGMTFYF